MIRFISTAVHGVMDYVMGLLLIVAPWLMNWSDGPETWVPVILGACVILYSLMTRYECGVIGLLPMSTHLTLDVMGGILLAASPWLFGFAEQVWLPHLVLGILEIGAGLMTQTVPKRGPGITESRPAGI